MTRNEDRSALLGHFFSSHVETTYAGTSVVADRKQFMKGLPLRLEVFRDKPKYPMFIAILKRTMIENDVFLVKFIAKSHQETSTHQRRRHISVMCLMFLDLRISSMLYVLVGDLVSS